jgi:homopolymeric O-antigen transport system permease protein
MAQSRSLLSRSESTRHFIDTLRVLVAREFRMRYKGSILGILWAVISPLGTVVVLQFLFTRVLNTGRPHFPVFLYCGILPWTWFQASAQAGASTLSDNRDLVRTPFFSKPLLPWTVTCTNFVFYLFSLPVLIALMLYDGLPLTGALVVLPVVWIVQWILTLGFALLMAAIGILVRDWQHLIAVILMFWFYLTPIFYDVAQVPPESARWFAYNPLTAIVTAHRAILIDGQPPDWAALGAVTVASAGLLGLSLLIFRALEDSFIDKA